MLIDDVTICIPSYERPLQLQRTLTYLAEGQINVVVQDGSARKLESSFVEKLPSRISYYHEPSSYLQRLKNFSSCIKTEFMRILPDDEFPLMVGLEHTRDYLRSHSDVGSCMGIPISFDLRYGSVRWRQSWPHLLPESELGWEISSRLIRHFGDYVPRHYYSLMSCTLFRQAVEFISESEPRCYAQTELEFEFGVCAMGRSAILPVSDWARSAEKTRHDLRGELDRWDLSLRFDYWWFDASRSAWRSRLIDQLSAKLEALEVGREHALPELVEEALNGYALRRLESRKWPRPINGILRSLPLTLQSSLRRHATAARSLRIAGLGASDFRYELRDQGIDVDLKEMLGVESHTKTFSKADPSPAS